MTIEELYVICKAQMDKGNSHKKIYISDDDEGNGYHQLYYGFTDTEEDIQEIQAYVYGEISREKASEVVTLG